MRRTLSIFPRISDLENGAQSERRVAFLSDRAFPDLDVYVVREDGSDTTPLTQDPTYQGCTAVFNESTILFLADNDGIRQVYTMRVDGSQLQQLTHSPETKRQPAMSPDGKNIVFTSKYAGGSAIYVVDRDGTQSRKLTAQLRMAKNPAMVS